MGRDITLGAAAREELIKGIDFVADAVKVTLGPQGGLVGLEAQGWVQAPHLTKDGVSVAKDITSSIQTVNMGCDLVKKVAGKAVDQAGDGTTTATILAQALAKEGNKCIVAGMKPRNITKGIELGVKSVIQELKTISREVKTNEEVKQVGTISANGDVEVGTKIAEAMEAVGKEGILTIEESNTEDFDIEVVKGMRFDKGYVSPAFVTDGNKMIAELHDPLILILKQKLVLGKPLEDILTKAAQKGRPTLIIAEDFEHSALPYLIANKIRGGLQICAVKAPAYGNFMADILADIAILTQGKVFSDELGIDLQNITPDFFGSAKKVVVTNEHTTIVDGNGHPELIEERCQALRDEIAEKKATHKVSEQERRLARLAGGIAVLRVGGVTETAMKERKDRVDDAVHATKAAVEEGIVPGGGVALFRARAVLDSLLNDSTLHQDVRAGVGIVKASMGIPLRQIVENAGESPDVVSSTIKANSNLSYGYDAETMEYVDMFEAGIIDPTKVVRTALQAASDIAVMVLNTKALCTEDKKTRQEMIQTAVFGNHK